METSALDGSAGNPAATGSDGQSEGDANGAANGGAGEGGSGTSGKSGSDVHVSA
jgi:hypothetical protein